MRKPLINPGIIKRLKSFFAIIQDTDTATRYIPAGKYVLYKNIACHASQNIESGDTLALGTNLVTDSDGFINCLNDKLGTKVNTSDIVNALTSTNSTKPLSAAQGKVLNDGLTTLNSNLNMTSDILTDALNCTGTKFFYGTGSSYTGSVPANTYQYGVFIVNVRGTDRMVIALSQSNDFAVNVHTGSAWAGWKTLLAIGDLTNMIKIVTVQGVVSTSDLVAGAHGYKEQAITIPSGYKTTGISAIALNHPGGANGLILTGTVGPNATGRQVIYLSYYSPHAISASVEDYTLYVLCIRSDFSIF